MQILGRKVRRRSVEGILKEIKYAIDVYGAHTIDFADEIFLFNIDYTKEILNALIDTSLNKKIKWTGLTRANFVNEDIIALAKRSGCIRLDMGIESGDDQILKDIGKSTTVEEVQQAVTIIKNLGIKLVTYYILGHPNETRESVYNTYKLAVKVNSDLIAVGLMVPYPGTKVYEYALKGEKGYRLLSKDWSQYDKYGGKALEITGLSYEELLKWQKKIYFDLYLKNYRLKDMLSFLWLRRHAIVHLIRKKVRRR